MSTTPSETELVVTGMQPGDLLNPNQVTDYGPKVVHLLSGEDIVAKVQAIPGGYRLERPVGIHVIPLENGAARISPRPLHPCTKDIEYMVVADMHVIWMADLSDPMLKSYTSFTSGLVLPDAGAQLTKLLTE